MELHKLSINQAHNGLVDKDFSALELAIAFLTRIEKMDKKILSFLTVTPELALSQAKVVDKLISDGEKIGPLAGIPAAIKDNILVKGIKCTAASKILENFIAPYDATCVRRLKEAGAVILGKTNMDEFAMGSSGERSAFGPTRNPKDLSRVPGGSSAGSAAAAAADLCCYSLGSDTGGSIRQPASFCGVVGLKPTYGAVSRYGLMAMASSLDQIGPFTKTPEDAKIVFEAISGKDPLDSTSIESQTSNIEHRTSNLEPRTSNLKIGVPKEYFIKGLESGVEKVIKKAIKKYECLGADIKEISLPHTEYAVATYFIIMSSEVSANLARYDGIKFGYSVVKPQINTDKKRMNTDTLLDVYLQSREQGFGDEVRRRIMLGTFALSAGYYEAYYLKAQKVRTLIGRDFERAFKTVDVIFTPVSPTAAFKIGEKLADPLTMYLSDIFTVSVNLAGLPAVSIPAGQANGLPVGLQIIGKPCSEEQILEIGQMLKT